MTPHYNLKQQEKQQWCFGDWAGVGGGVTNIFVIYLGGGVSMFFQRDWGGGRQNFCLPHENVTGPPPPPSNKWLFPNITVSSVNLTWFIIIDILICKCGKFCLATMATLLVTWQSSTVDTRMNTRVAIFWWVRSIFFNISFLLIILIGEFPKLS